MKKRSLLFLSIITLSLTYAMTFTAAYAAPRKTAFVDYVDFDIASEDTWDALGTELTRTIVTEQQTQNKYMQLEQTSAGSSFYLKSFKSAKALSASLTDTALPAVLVIKARLALDTIGDGSSSYAELQLTNGESPKASLVRINSNRVISIHNNIKNASEAGDSSSVRVITRSYTPGSWVDAVCVISIEENGTAVFRYYIDGVKYTSLSGSAAAFTFENFNQNTSRQLSIGLSGTTQAMCAKADDMEMYMVSGGTPALTAELSSAQTDAAPDGDIVISFSNEIYKDGVSLTVDGETVESSRIRTGNDSKSIIISAPAGGFEANTEHTVLISSAADVFGGSIKNKSFAFTVSAEDTPVFGTPQISVENNTVSVTAAASNPTGNDISVWVITAMYGGSRFLGAQKTAVPIAADTADTAVGMTAPLMGGTDSIKAMLLSADGLLTPLSGCAVLP